MTSIPTRSGVNFPLVAWTGGSSPKEGLANVSQAVRETYSDIMGYLLDEQIRTYESFWNESPLARTLEIFTLRASCDAWATLREAGLVT